MFLAIMRFSCLSLFMTIASTTRLAYALPRTSNTKGNSVIIPVVPANYESGPLNKRSSDASTFDVAEVWTDHNMEGSDGILVLDSLPTCCLNFVSPFVDSISSLQVFPGFLCGFFVDINCSGPGFNLTNKYISDLNGGIFQDSISSMSCDALPK